ncbi:MAG: dTDP-4-dehydrorhamnose 3,5-epimerase [Bacteroidales bacterium]|jgi:dTDP-4-dehydrorhamnose 3,5-epimerase|nr:dTDP-4-dehydrorhamnose 3,5-epimerase [Bacteroidales bacterium]
MEVIPLPIEGVLLVKPQIFGDARGWFYETYNEERYRAAGIGVKFVQDNQSFSQKNVVRGLHFQRPPFTQAKLVSVIQGAVLDVAVDLRADSPTYGKYVSAVLTGENHHQLFVPEGFAHGFSVLEDNTIFAYKCSNFYHKESEGNIVYNDPDIHVEWGVENPILSDKDKVGPTLREFVTPF